jgi:hypothetical protein
MSLLHPRGARGPKPGGPIERIRPARGAGTSAGTTFRTMDPS